jgi:acetyl-CoA carboxylase biotin carboxylase subunit
MECGAVVTPHYDSMIAKLVVHGASRSEALARLRAALDEMQVGGIATNLALHRRLVREPGVIEGGFDIHHLERWLVAA